MKQKKVNRYIITMLVLVFTLTMAGSTYAASDVLYVEPASEISLDAASSKVIPTSEDGITYHDVFADNSVSESVHQDGEYATKIAATRLPCAIYSVYAYPAVLCENTGVSYTLSGVYARGIWSTPTYIGSSISLTTSQINSLNSRCLAYFQNLNDGYTYSLVGWEVKNTFNIYQAGTIEYSAWSSRWPCVQGNDEIKTSLAAGTSLTITRSFLVDPTVTSYSSSGTIGSYYVRSTGLGWMIGSVGVVLNPK